MTLTISDNKIPCMYLTIIFKDFQLSYCIYPVACSHHVSSTDSTVFCTRLTTDFKLKSLVRSKIQILRFWRHMFLLHEANKGCATVQCNSHLWLELSNPPSLLFLSEALDSIPTLSAFPCLVSINVTITIKILPGILPQFLYFILSSCWKHSYHTLLGWILLTSDFWWCSQPLPLVWPGNADFQVSSQDVPSAIHKI